MTKLLDDKILREIIREINESPWLISMVCSGLKNPMEEEPNLRRFCQGLIRKIMFKSSMMISDVISELESLND